MHLPKRSWAFFLLNDPANPESAYGLQTGASRGLRSWNSQKLSASIKAEERDIAMLKSKTRSLRPGKKLEAVEGSPPSPLTSWLAQLF
jgi:hypothetical protein